VQIPRAAAHGIAGRRKGLARRGGPFQVVIASHLMSTKLKWFLAALAVALPLDQITKYWIIANFRYGEVHEVIPGFFDLTHVRNPGGAFSFFAHGPSEWRMAFFVGTTSIALVLLVIFLIRHEPGARLSPLALGAIMGGALGNLLDRLVHGEVIDFLDIHVYGGYTWPTFNVADSAIVIGVFILMIEVYFFEQPDAESGDDPAALAQTSRPVNH
jgi:signal peptidase II